MTSLSRTALTLVLAGALTALAAVEGLAQSDPKKPPEAKASVVEPAPRVYDLKLAIETALRRHPSLTVAEARSQAAKSGIASAGAQYRPTIEGHASLAHTLAGDRGAGFSNETATQNATRGTPYYTAALGLTVPLFREGVLPFSTLPSEDVARAKYDSVKLGERLSRGEVIGNVTVAFFTALAGREEVILNQQIVDLHRVLYDNARLRFTQQLVAQAEVLTAEAALFSASSDLEVARANRDGSLAAFLNTLGVNSATMRLSEIVLVDREEPTPVVPPLEDLLRQVTSSHPAVLVQEAKVREATAALQKVRTGWYPTLDAVMGIGTLDDFSPPTDAWSLRALLRLNWKIFDFGLLDLKTKEQNEVLRAEKGALEEIRNRVGQPVITAYRTLTGSQARITASEKLVELAEELTRGSRQRFQQNLIPMADVLKTEASLAAARRALIQARNTVRVDHALLQLALGAE